MGIVRTKGIVIKIANSSENDKILTVLTAERGKIRVFCKGAKKTKSTFLASTEFLSFSDMVLFEGKKAADAVKDLMLRDKKIEITETQWEE